jgi:hypothetical protein
MRVITLFSLLVLTGCSQRFDCPYKDGVRCMRLSEVDKQISVGKLTSKNKTKPLKTLEPQDLPDSPLRAPEQVLTVWIAPYQTMDGTYHEEKRMHFVARPAEWLNTVNEIENEQETLTESH